MRLKNFKIGLLDFPVQFWSMFLLVALFATPCFPDDVTGKWDATFRYGSACQWEGTLDLVQSGSPGFLGGSGEIEVTSGTCTDSFGAIRGSIEETTLSFVFPLGEATEAQITGTLSGIELNGDWVTTAGGFSGSWTAIPAETIDQICDAKGGASLAATSGSSLAQTFTANKEGLLTTIDLMISRNEEATGDFSIIILPTNSSGEPDGSGNYLFSKNFPVTAISAIGSFQGTYMSFDVSSADIWVSPGDRLAIAVLHSGTYPDWVMWDGEGRDEYSGGMQFIERSGGTMNWTVGNGPTWDVGFRTFVRGTNEDVVTRSSLPLPLLNAAMAKRASNAHKGNSD